MKRIVLVLTLLALASASLEAGWFSRKKKQEEEVPGSHPTQLVAPNGTVVPAWASRRMAESPVPLAGPSWGRRPWAVALANQATPSAVYARAYQLGFGPGTVPGFTNGPGLAGNIPSAPVGPGNGNGWGPPAGAPYFMPIYPFNTTLAGGY